MIERRVTHSRKDEHGNIVALCNPSEYWSPRLKNAAIRDIKNEIFIYYVKDSKGNRSYINIAHGLTGEILRADSNGWDNLDNLPDC